ncbi:hypothetical protein B0T18DRAFT_121263 [Schizothecium vesticola]|uniref:Uncharacterized protein n=1 Tax=Schizothecium vesticola TaxID=314040 RepID=A0AA40F2M1_9PEZI|nr:hypothetical protein B0T18DRAFT_121263 [Schizothecium vesticola]
MHPPLLFTGTDKTMALPDARHMAALLSNCLKYQWEDLSESLIGMAASQLYEADVSDMQEFWVPGFFLPLIHLLPDCETESSLQSGTPWQQTSAQSLVQLIVRQYLHLLIGRMPLASAQDYWRDPASCTNHCELCDKLNSFLQSQHQATSFLYHTETVYDHMASQINSCEHCKFVAEPVSRDGREQYILVVTKTAQTFEQRKAGWEARLATAREFVAKLKEKPLQARLKVLFGGRCDSVINIDLRNPFKIQQETVHWQGQDGPIRPLDHPLLLERGSDFPPALAGSKRKAEDQGQRRISGHHGG